MLSLLFSIQDFEATVASSQPVLKILDDIFGSRGASVLMGLVSLRRRKRAKTQLTIVSDHRLRLALWAVFDHGQLAHDVLCTCTSTSTVARCAATDAAISSSRAMVRSRRSLITSTTTSSLPSELVRALIFSSLEIGPLIAAFVQSGSLSCWRSFSPFPPSEAASRASSFLE